MAGKVTVYGRNVMRPPLCDSDEAQMIVVKDASGVPAILLVRLVGDQWGLSTPDDKDWPELCVRFGLMPPPPTAEILARAH